MKVKSEYQGMVTTTQLTQKLAAPIQAMVKEFFAVRGIAVRTLYRTCSEAFGDSLGGNCPGNLIPKSPLSARVTVFLDFKDTNIHLGNFRKIIAFPESVVSELPRHPQWRSGVEKIDLEVLSHKYVFRDWNDLQANYSRIFE